MTRLRTLLIALACVLSFSAQQALANTAVADAEVEKVFSSDRILGETDDPAFIEKIKNRFSLIMTNSQLVEATIEQNQRGATLDEIRAIDKQWIDAEDFLPIQNEKQSGPCAAELKSIMDRSVIEIFVMDDQGAIVCENDLTSDYWQGDEAKWVNSYSNGKGGIDIGKLKFDRSADAMIQQVSLPMISDDGSVVGAVTIGLVPERL